MIHVSDLARIPSPRWIINISDDPASGLKRKVKAWDLDFDADKVLLKCFVHFCNSSHEELEGIRYTPYQVDLIAKIDITGPFINPSTGLRVYPDADGWLPDGTILRYDAVMSLCETTVVVDTQVLGFITTADDNGEFNI